MGINVTGYFVDHLIKSFNCEDLLLFSDIKWNIFGLNIWLLSKWIRDFEDITLGLE